MTAAQIKAIILIQKLLNLAAKAGTAEEAASANAKVRELLTKHKLDDALAERERDIIGRRAHQPPAPQDEFEWALAWALAR
jgi:uncharacterized protein DUF2786